MKSKPISRGWLVVTAVILTASVASTAGAGAGAKATAVAGFTVVAMSGAAVTGSAEAIAGTGLATMALTLIALRRKAKPRDRGHGGDPNALRFGDGRPPSGGASAHPGGRKLTWFADSIRKLFGAPQEWISAKMLMP